MTITDYSIPFRSVFLFCLKNGGKTLPWLIAWSQSIKTEQSVVEENRAEIAEMKVSVKVRMNNQRE
jgi:hypothetical protein